MAAELGVAPEVISPEEHRRNLIVIGALMLGMILASLDQTIVATALPTIAGDLHGLNHLSWVVTAYLLTSTISTPLWGKTGDLFGRKQLYQGAIVIFLVGSALAGLSHSMAQLILCRAVQGVGAGGLMVGSQAITGDVISPRQRGRYMGYFGAVFGLTSVAGPLLGGLFTEHLSWRWIFYINVPIGIVALFVIAAVLHLPVKRSAPVIDYLGVAVLGVAVTALILLTSWGGTTYAWSSATIVGLAVLTCVLVPVFMVVQRRAAEPLMPLGMFRIRAFSVSSLVGFVVGMIMFGAIIYIPLYLQTVHGASPTNSGLQLLPLVCGMLTTFIISGRLMSRWGRYKIFPVVGTAVMTVGLFLLSLMGRDTSLLVSSIFMVVVGLGFGLIMQVIVVAVQNAVPYRQLGTATSSATFFRSIGMCFGVALFGAVLNSRLFAELARYLPAAAFRQLHGHNISSNPAQLDALRPALRVGYEQAFSHSLDTVFLIAVPFGVVAFLLTLLLKEVPLRDQAHVSSGQPQDKSSSGPDAVSIDDAEEGTMVAVMEGLPAL